MAVFTYKALNGRHMVIEGAITADSPRQARDILRDQGLIVQDVEAQKTQSMRRWWRRHAGNTVRVAATVRELGTLLSVGVPLVEALDTLASQYKGPYRTSLLLVRDRVASGASLAEALAAQPAIFDELTCRMVEVGENAGNLDQILDQLADFKGRSLQLKDRVTSAL